VALTSRPLLWVQAAEKLADDLRRALDASRAREAADAQRFGESELRATATAADYAERIADAERLLEAAEASGRAEAAERELEALRDEAKASAVAAEAHATAQAAEAQASLERQLQARRACKFSVRCEGDHMVAVSNVRPWLGLQRLSTAAAPIITHL
jgi:hypothetical protein